MAFTEIVSKLATVANYSGLWKDHQFVYHLIQDGNVKDFIRGFIAGSKAIKEKYDKRFDPRFKVDEEFVSDLSNLVESLTKFVKHNQNLGKAVDKWLTLRKESIDKLQGLIDEMHSRKKDVNIARLSGASGGIVSGGLAILGVVLSQVTAGGSLVLTGVGIGLGVASTATGIGATAVGAILENGTVSDIKDVLAKDEMQSKEMYEGTRQAEDIKKTVEEYWDKIKETIENLLSVLPSKGKIIATAVKDVGGKTVPAVKFFGKLVTNMDDVLKGVARSGTKVAGRVVGVGLIAIGIAVDAFDLIFTSIDVHKGSRSQIANKIEKEVLQVLKNEYEQFKSATSIMTI